MIGHPGERHQHKVCKFEPLIILFVKDCLQSGVKKNHCH